MVSGHAGLAATGLLVWVSFLVSGLTALAWVAACLLLPVAGLGMATLTLWSSGPRPGPAGPPRAGQGRPLVPTLTAAPSAAAGAVPPAAQAGPDQVAGVPPGTAPGRQASMTEVPSPSGRPRPPGLLAVMLPIVHGLAATAAILLALLTAVGTG